MNPHLFGWILTAESPFQDLKDFEKRRDGTRTQALDRLAREVDEAGLYGASYTGDD